MFSISSPHLQGRLGSCKSQQPVPDPQHVLTGIAEGQGRKALPRLQVHVP